MRLALFVGCKITAAVPEYETAARAVLGRLGIELVSLPFGCCGFPARHLRLDAFLMLAARNLALAAARDLGLLTLCQCCYGNLRQAQYLMRRDSHLRAAIDKRLATEGLTLTEDPPVRHLLDFLARDIGVETLAGRVTAPQRQLKVAAHYGCHALRPSNVVELDNPNAPTVFEALIRVTGATTVDWPRRLDCCGAPLADTNQAIATRLRQAKLTDAAEAGAGWLATACPHCQIQFAGGQDAGAPKPVLYAQILGMALGLSATAVGLRQPLVSG